MKQSIFALPIQNRPNSAATQGKTSHLDFHRIQYTINGMKVHAATFFTQYNTLESTIKSGNMTSDCNVIRLANKHKEAIKQALDIDDKTCRDMFYHRIAMATIFELIFDTNTGVVPNINITHEIVSHCNQAGNFAMPAMFFEKILKTCKEFNITKTKIKDLKASLTIENSNEITCTISTHTKIYKHNQTQGYVLPFKLTFTMMPENSHSFSDMLYKNITLEVTVPDTIQKYITNNTTSSKIESNRITLTNMCRNSEGNTHLTYSLPNLKIPSLINKSSFGAIVKHNYESVESCSPVVQHQTHH
ncbi:hypothetical protein ECH_0865 [Ehrlichia chaffeensis str. Arkansas]|uniref:Uncharacterized protein n=2 Tax=Ehrlichia chaffeensis TaxID=945 RepID=Q2GFX3_EHRCR|nr:hypothetical protein ECH_0865 [Ehrlichia chaffeensis str. Arkansas]